ncbi:hypothetical protein D3C84_340630 [compost metagenome]
MTFPATPVQEHAFTGGAVRVAAAGRGQASVVIGGFLVEGGLELPVVGQSLFQGGEVGDVVEVATAPVGARVEVTGKIGASAVGEIGRVTGPGGPARGHAGLVDAEGQQGVRGQVGFQDAVEQVLLLAVMIEVGVFVLIGADEAPAQAAAVVQRSGDIAFGAVGVPGADGTADRGLERFGRLLANQVDRGRGVAGAGHQAGSALDHFNTVQGGRIDVSGCFTVNTVVDAVDAIVLVVGDGKAAGRELHAVGVVGLLRDARGIAQHVADILCATVVHLLAGDHGDRLRRFTQ